MEQGNKREGEVRHASKCLSLITADCDGTLQHDPNYMYFAKGVHVARGSFGLVVIQFFLRSATCLFL